MNNWLVFICLCYSLLNCNAQSTESKNTANNKNEPKATIKPNIIVGGGCDGCELMYVGMLDLITAIDTSTAWNEGGQRLIIEGKAQRINSEEAAKNVIIYYWQTDQNGYYSEGEGAHQGASRHGHIRGWVKTDEMGRFAIHTIRPAAYPNTDIPAHIHISIKEPNLTNEYYIDEFVFDDDPLLNPEKRQALENRGGSGILQPKLQEGILIAQHDIILGLNIPDYP